MGSILTVTIACFIAAIVAAYLQGNNRALAKLIKQQERQHRREVRRSAQLLDRLIMKHGFTPLSEPAVMRESGAILTMPVADPFEAAESEWEKEDRARFQLATMSDEERAELINEARKRVG